MTDAPQPYPAPADHPETIAAFVAMRDGQPQRARAIAEAAITRNANNRVLRFILAQSLTRTNAADKAVRHLQRLVKAEPENVWFLIELANALDGTGHTDDALRQIDRALAIEPDHDFAILIYAQILRGVGEARRAWDELSARIDTLPRTNHVALALGGVIPKDADATEVLERLNTSSHNTALNTAERRGAFFAVAKILDKRGRYDEAFNAAAAANHLVNGPPSDYHAEVFEQLSPKLVASVEPANLDASHVVLVCGMPRSGTTVTEQILAAHPRAATAGEFNGLPLVTEQAAKHAAREGFVPAELATKLAKTYLKSLADHAGTLPAGKQTVLIDKLPTNIIILGLVARLLPGVRMIRCTRDLRDIAISCHMQDFGDRLVFRTRLDTLADELLLHERIADRWRADLGNQMLESSLEELIADPEPRARALLAHAGLEWDPSVLRYYETKRHVRTFSVDQVRVGLNASSVGRWKNYERQLAPLIERLQASGMLTA
ncbi:MAG: hypothetical protein ACI89L_000299 [Phycisphaerales bacterium]|jgi:hypothetical protein